MRFCLLPLDGEWSEESINRFEELSHCAQWSELMARVVGFQEIDDEQLPCLELIDTKQEKVKLIDHLLLFCLKDVCDSVY